MSIAKTIGLHHGGLRTASTRSVKVATRVAPAWKPTAMAISAVTRVANLTLDMFLAAVVIAVPVTIIGAVAALLTSLLGNH